MLESILSFISVMWVGVIKIDGISFSPVVLAWSLTLFGYLAANSIKPQENI